MCLICIFSSDANRVILLPFTFSSLTGAIEGSGQVSDFIDRKHAVTQHPKAVSVHPA